MVKLHLKGPVDIGHFNSKFLLFSLNKQRWKGGNQNIYMYKTYVLWENGSRDWKQTHSLMSQARPVKVRGSMEA